MASFDDPETAPGEETTVDADLGTTKGMGDSSAGETPGAEGDFGPGASGKDDSNRGAAKNAEKETE